MFVMVCFRVKMTIMPMKTRDIPIVAPMKNKLEPKMSSSESRREKET